MKPLEDRVWGELKLLFEPYTVTELATILGISKSRASRLKNCQCAIPRLDTMEKLASKLGKEVLVFIVKQ